MRSRLPLTFEIYRPSRITVAHRAVPLAMALVAACGTPSQPHDAGIDADVTTTDVASDAVDVPPLPPQFTVLTADPQYAALADYAASTRLARVAAIDTPAPLDDLANGRGDGIRIAALADLTSCTECYRLEQMPAGYVVHGDGVLGLQYGLSHLLEAFGYRFFHPFDGHAPADPTAGPIDLTAFGPTFAPEMSVRGLQPWTLHPIESLAFWVPSARHADEAHAILDWTVRNRGNTVAIAALDDILSEASNATWRAHMRTILDLAHLRGMHIGVDIQLFGGMSSLQHAYTLLTDPNDPNPADTMRARYHTLLDGLPFDAINLSFGEFNGVSPDLFISSTNLAKQILDEVAPGTEMSATIHVGCYPSLQVTYMGQTLQYYLLVQYADPSIVPWVHNVMYETLFDPVGGAYGCTDFADHRDYLLSRLQSHAAVAYNPEDSYWVAFDDSIPVYLPVYMHSRWRDMQQIRAAATAQGGAMLDRQVTFSTGWEWGYWQNDAAALRMSFALPDHWSQPIEDMFAPWGDAGRALASAIAQLGDAQFDALVTHQLAAYLAGRDALIDYGQSNLGIVSQPPRPQFADVVAMDATARATFATNVLAPLDALAAATDAARDAVNAIAVDPADPWFSEMRDAFTVDAARTRFAADVWHAAERMGAVGNDAGYLALAQQALADGQAAVAHRHANLHWPEPASILLRSYNPTVYPMGYLYFADSLCYWQRELEQITAIVQGRAANPPTCFLVS